MARFLPPEKFLRVSEGCEPSGGRLLTQKNQTIREVMPMSGSCHTFPLNRRIEVDFESARILMQRIERASFEAIPSAIVLRNILGCQPTRS